MSYKPWWQPCRKVELTGRQKEVMELVCAGKTDPQIADIMGLSVNTAKNHLRDIRRKLGAENRTLAVAKYLKR